MAEEINYKDNKETFEIPELTCKICKKMWYNCKCGKNNCIDRKKEETFESYIEKWKKRNKSNACMYDYIKQLHDQEIEELNHNMEYLNLTSDRFLDKISILKYELKEKDKQIAELQRNITDIHIKLFELENKNKELTKANKEWFKENKEFSEENIILEQKNKELQAEIQRLKACFDE